MIIQLDLSSSQWGCTLGGDFCQQTQLRHHPNSVILKSLELGPQFISLCCVQLFATPWTAAGQASLSITNSQSLLRLMSIESVIPSNYLIFCHPLLLPP